MELLEGETLRNRIARGPLTTRDAMDVAVTVADALADVHAKGITHRYFKPENIFLTADGPDQDSRFRSRPLAATRGRWATRAAAPTPRPKQES